MYQPPDLCVCGDACAIPSMLAHDNSNTQVSWLLKHTLLRTQAMQASGRRRPPPQTRQRLCPSTAGTSTRATRPRRTPRA